MPGAARPADPLPPRHRATLAAGAARQLTSALAGVTLAVPDFRRHDMTTQPDIEGIRRQIAATIHAFKDPIQNWHWSVAWIFLVLGLAYLMTSTIRFYSFKDLPWTRKQPSVAIVMIALLGAAIWRWSEEVLLLFAATYTAAGVTLHIIRLLRHRLVSRTA